MSEEKPKRGRPTKKAEPQVEQETIAAEQEQVITMSFEEAMEAGVLDGLIPHSAPQPRHTQIFDEEIDSETVQKLINELNNYTAIDLWVSTPGGSLAAMGALVHYLNKRKEDITIYLHDTLASAGTFLLTDFEGELVITEDLDFILFHLADRMAYTRRKDKTLNMAELGRQLDIINSKRCAKYRELGLTEAEITKYNKGKDVILYRKDFHRLNINKAPLIEG